MLETPDYAADRLTLRCVADRLTDHAVEDYLTGNGHRIAATRFILEALHIPLPRWAERGVSGRRAATRDALERFRQDNPDDNLPRG
jgi:hypothetical protein